ncbi:Gfo/Idh/MocA family oxidoreductase [Priestia filamentosa]|uniref:Gfo/Idh/MocA family protein n=1 Tax=Priestia filamentosa TaxID=1402861 RepID=UPI0039787B79
MVHVGIIGCGRIAEKHIASISQFEEITVVAISDLSTERMEAIKAMLTNPTQVKTYHQYEDLLLNDEIDLIVIATSSGSHASIVKKALSVKKHVLVEKPLSLSLHESRQLTAFASQQNCHLLVCHQLRYRKLMMQIKKMIENGKLGKIYYGKATMEIYRVPSYFEQAPWRGTWKDDGGMLINQGIHIIDLLLWFLGDVSSIYGDMMKVHPQKETEDVSVAMLRFKSGAKGLIEGNIITYPRNYGYSLRLFAENGTVILSGNQLDQIDWFEIEDLKEDLRQNLLELQDDRLEHVRMYEAIVCKITGGEPELLVDGKEAEKALETVFAFYSSVLYKKEISLPLSSFSTTIMEKWNEHK